ncbi:ester cyclase [Actinophytocola sp. NPDC049390]|uniref:ester cyclase n=1 Tax=Actinophytocola sp. NPDC049390 TaxID=3363894 RepID=UPI0037A1FB0C
MDMTEATGEWTAAWARRDPAAVAAVAAAYTDPDTTEPVSGDALVAHVTAVLAAFPAVELDFDSPAVAGSTAVLAWTLKAAHRGEWHGIPGTGAQAAVTGVDVLTLAGGEVTVRRHYDRLALAESLGYTPRFVPESDGVQDYGSSSRAGTGRTALPGAITLTWLDFRDDAEGAELDLLSVEVVKSLRASRGFLGMSTFEFGTRKYTLAAFDRPESVRAVHARPHQRAMRRFFKGGLCSGAYTSVWTLARHSVYLRCPDCGSMVDSTDDRACDCGTTPTTTPLF